MFLMISGGKTVQSKNTQLNERKMLSGNNERSLRKIKNRIIHNLSLQI